ncbi:MAG: enoyl-CoA hydratase-related protein [Myxococcota bacterium]|nr:enoyl-CoA hydratase-related protein [Myxococcota bacterium]
MSYRTLLVDHAGAILTVTINRPDKRNALCDVVLGELAELCASLARRPELRGMILTGAGERAFVAGADIARMAEMTPDEGAAFGRLGQCVTELVEALPFPVIACVNGYALGGGCELAMSADFIYATARAVFGQPEVSLGLIPGFGGCVRLGRFVGPGRAKELIYSGRTVAADEALRIGLVNAVFSTKAAMLEAAVATLGEIGRRSPVAVALCKDVLRSLEGKSTAERLAVEATAFRRAFESPDKREGVAAFVAKRPPVFPGHVAGRIASRQEL